ncbi:MAG: serine/threonine-protein phosphatase, partial [Leptospira sp.]|nr:serine/threonine-protein phosphatase [Leptospira sp.]
ANAGANYANINGKYLNMSQVESARRSISLTGNLSYKLDVMDGTRKINTTKFTFVSRDKFDILTDFLPYIFISLAFILIATWYFLQYRDIYIFLLFLGLSVFIVSNFFLLAFGELLFVFFVTLFLISFFLVNFIFRLRGNEISPKWLIPEFSFAIMGGFIGVSESSDLQVFTEISSFAVKCILGVSFLSISIILYDILKYKANLSVNSKKVSLAFSISLITFVPFLIHHNYNILSGNLKSFMFISFLSFPVFFIYGTYRYTLIPVQLLFNRSITVIYLVGIYLSFYFLLIGSQKYFVPGLNEQSKIALNLVFLIISMSTLSNIKKLVNDAIDYWTFRRNTKLNDSLDRAVSLIASPISMKATVNALLRHVTETLDVKKIVILIPGDRFPNTDLKKINLMKMPSNSEIWEFFSSHKSITVTSPLLYGAGIRESVFNFLRGLEIQLAYPMTGSGRSGPVDAIFLVGEKNNHKNFSLGELRYIKECTRISNLLLQNYFLLSEDIEKKRLVRDLKIAAILDHVINPLNPNSLEDAEVGYLSIPAVGVSGDYLDFIKLGPNQILIMLGDVAGHGLGSGYLVSAIKAISRQSLHYGQDIVEVFKNINNFLIERYAGNEFMTLLGGILDSKNRVFNFINAGHLPAIIQRKNGEIESISGSQRVLGIVPTAYRLNSVALNPKDKLIIYSDGVTETFGPKDEVYGDERFLQLLKNNHKTTASELPQIIRKSLIDFRKDHEISDDVSFISATLK